MKKHRDRPDKATVVTDYLLFDRYVAAFAGQLLNLLIIIGGPGLAKSRRFQSALGSQQVCILNGNLTGYRLYKRLYEHQDQPVVLDDVDKLYRDASAVNVLKSLCETSERKQISWHSAAPEITSGELPETFTTRSKVAIIANDWRRLDQNVGALEDRGQLLFFAPNAIEVHRETAKWFGHKGEDPKVFDFIGENLHLIKKPSMRSYVLASEQKKANLPWRESLLQRWLSGKAYEVARLLLDDSYQTEAERVIEYTRRTGGKSSDYYNHKAKILPQHCPPEIFLDALKDRYYHSDNSTSPVAS